MIEERDYSEIDEMPDGTILFTLPAGSQAYSLCTDLGILLENVNLRMIFDALENGDFEWWLVQIWFDGDYRTILDSGNVYQD